MLLLPISEDKNSKCPAMKIITAFEAGNLALVKRT